MPRPADDATDTAAQAAYGRYKDDLLAFVGAISANSSQGSQWKDRVEGATLSVQAAMPQAPPRPILKMNLKLTVG